MTRISMSDTPPAGLDVDALVIGLFAGTDHRPVLAPGAESVDDATGGRLVESLTLLDASGSAGEVVRLVTFGRTACPVVTAVGLGALPPEDRSVGADPLPQIGPGAIRSASAEAVRALAGKKRIGLALALLKPGDRELLGATAEGALLGAYEFAGYRTVEDGSGRRPVSEIVLLVRGEVTDAHRCVVERARIVASAACAARDWVNTPANRLPPAAFADAVADGARNAGLGVEILDETQLRVAGYGGILAVGGGSDAPPRLVRLAYRPDPSAVGWQVPHLVLVGKGITFDAGGLSIKPAQGMWAMKSDMAGAAAVAATMIALGRLRPAIAVTAYLPMAENLPGCGAYRPGDVVTMYGGRTVEVINTDAEGRLVVADAIVRACEDDPDYLVEASTLTGNGTLGKGISGVMGEEWLVGRIVAAGERAGELMWPMPLPADVRRSLRSPIADSLQMSAGMDWAGLMSQGGNFLAGFIPEGLRWAHLDIAGQAMASRADGVHGEGATGVPVRALLSLIEDLVAGTA
jgi:leucyl aminopeptidase